MALPKPLEPLDQVPLIAGAVRAIRDIDAAVAEFAARAFVSNLTGLLNRAAFDAIAEDFNRMQAGAGAGIAFIDLTGFKRINDTHGYEAGNICISEAGRRLSDVAGDKALAFHFSGDEFVALFEPESRHRFADQFTKTMAEFTVTLDDKTVSVNAAIGIAVPDGNASLGELRRRSERACKFGKRTGKAATWWTKDIEDKAPVDRRWRCGTCATEVSIVVDPATSLHALKCPVCATAPGDAGKSGPA